MHKKWAVISSYVQYLHSKLWILRAFLSSFYVSFIELKHVLAFGCLLAFLAKFKHDFSRRFSNVSSSSMSNAIWYDLYLKPRIILSTVFCTLSRSSLFSTVIELCNCARPNKSCCGGEFRLGYLFPMQRSTENWLRHIQ